MRSRIMPKGPFFCALHHALWHTDTLSELLRKNNSLTLKSTRREKTKNDIVGDSVGTGHDRARGGHGHKQVAPIRQVSPLHVGDARPRDPCVYLAPIVLGLGLGLALKAAGGWAQGTTFFIFLSLNIKAARQIVTCICAMYTQSAVVVGGGGTEKHMVQ